MRQNNFTLVTVFILAIALPFFLVGGCDDNDSTGADGSGDGGGQIEVRNDEIGGTVSNAGDPLVGAWVTAMMLTGEQIQPTDSDIGYAPVNMLKTVVTDNNGNYIIPDLDPDQEYDVMIRVYGYPDVTITGQSTGNRTDYEYSDADVLSQQDAAQAYPANYWKSMIDYPSAERIAQIDVNEDEQPDYPAGPTQYIGNMWLGCELCHQIGNEATRVPKTEAGWDAVWQLAGAMDGTADRLDRPLMMETMAAWSDKIADGEVPPQPPRPGGEAGRYILTQWYAGTPFTYAHDMSSTQRHYGTVNINGPVWSCDIGQDYYYELDIVNNRQRAWKVPTIDDMPAWCDQPGFCTWTVYNNPAHPHTTDIGPDGKVYAATKIQEQNEDYCAEYQINLDNGNSAGYKISVFDPVTQTWELIPTCHNYHHLSFDDDNAVWGCTNRAIVGGYDIDNGEEIWSYYASVTEAGEGTEVDATFEENSFGAAKTGSYYVEVAPDQAIWYSQINQNTVGRVYPDRDPETFDPAEDWEVPFPGFGPRIIGVDSNGILWAPLGGSGHLGRLDPDTGEWTLYETPGPRKNVPENISGAANFHYALWVDRHNFSGLGADTVYLMGTDADSIYAFDQDTEEFTTYRIPFPRSTFTRLADSRQDDPEFAGDGISTTGKALWFVNGIDPAKHVEPVGDDMPQPYMGRMQFFTEGEADARGLDYD